MTETLTDQFVCPRCGSNVSARFYGPCDRCRVELCEAATVVPLGRTPAVSDDRGEHVRPTPSPAEAPPQHSPATLTTRRVFRQLGGGRLALADWVSGRVLGDHVDLAVTGRATLDETLTAAAGAGVDRLLMVGVEAPALLAEWSTTVPPDGWSAGAAYTDGDRPTIRYLSADGRTVTFAVAAAWTGDVDDVAQAHRGLQLARQLLDDAFPGNVALLASPATTGRELFARLVPDDGYPCLPDDLQQLIRATSPQHRMELTQLPGMQLPGLHEVDMRLAYAAVCWGLPAGVPRRVTGEPADWHPHQRGRYFARWRVPDDWAHVGILPERDEDGWRWPAEPGDIGAGWVDGTELALARRHGWPVQVTEAVVWPDRGPDPLRSWSHRLAQASQAAERLGDNGREPRGAAAAARAALRACLIHGLGAFVGRRHTVTHTIPAGSDQRPPAGAPFDVVWGTGAIVWREDRPAAWPAMSHPEWAAAVWARTRCRLLTGPGGLGALALPRHELVGFRGDALYLAHDPSWADSGRPGGWRTKGDPLGPFTMPETLPQLDQLRRRGADPARGLQAARAALAGQR